MFLQVGGQQIGRRTRADGQGLAAGVTQFLGGDVPDAEADAEQGGEGQATEPEGQAAPETGEAEEVTSG